LSQKSHDELLDSFKEFDYVELIAINKDGTILAGHQRVHIMLELGWADTEIEVRVPSRLLTAKQANRYLIRSNKAVGDWDYEILKDMVDFDELKELGFNDKDFQIEDWESNLDDSVDEDEKDELEETVKIVCQKGHKDSIIEIIKPLLKDLDVKIS